MAREPPVLSEIPVDLVGATLEVARAAQENGRDPPDEVPTCPPLSLRDQFANWSRQSVIPAEPSKHRAPRAKTYNDTHLPGAFRRLGIFPRGRLIAAPTTEGKTSARFPRSRNPQSVSSWAKRRIFPLGACGNKRFFASLRMTSFKRYSNVGAAIMSRETW